MSFEGWGWIFGESKLHYVLRGTSLCGRFHDLPEPDHVIHPLGHGRPLAGQCWAVCRKRLAHLNDTTGVLFAQSRADS